jgi:hypothetical protein
MSINQAFQHARKINTNKEKEKPSKKTAKKGSKKE